jgi:hypothetical protein
MPHHRKNLFFDELNEQLDIIAPIKRMFLFFLRTIGFAI